MTQTVIIQNIALQHAQQQIQELQRSSGAGQISSGPSSFLGQQQQAPRSSAYAQQSGSYAASAAVRRAQSRWTRPERGGERCSQLSYGEPRKQPPELPRARSHLKEYSTCSRILDSAAEGCLGVAGLAAMDLPSKKPCNNYYDNGPGNSGGGDYSTSDGRDDYQATDDATNVDDNSSVDNVDDSQYDDNGAGFDDNSGGDSFCVINRFRQAVLHLFFSRLFRATCPSRFGGSR